MKRFNRRTVVVLAVAAVALMAAIGGYAYWTQGGSGTGSATAGNTVAITVNQTSVSAGTLYPGGPAEALSGDFDNPNAHAVNISSVTAAVSSISGAGTDAAKPACTTADFAIGGTSGATVVPSGTGVGSWSGLNISLLDNGLNQDNCKGATANITYTANA